MNMEYLSAFLRFIRFAYSNEAAYGRWCQRLIYKIRAENPGLATNFRTYYFGNYGAFDTDAGSTISTLAEGLGITPTEAGVLLVNAIRKPFARLWNRSADPGAILMLYATGRDVPYSVLDSSLGEDFLIAQNDAEYGLEQARASSDEESAERYQDQLNDLEQANYEGGIGNWDSFVNEVAERMAEITDADYVGGGTLSQAARKRIYRINKGYADELRELLERPDPMDTLRTGPRRPRRR